MDTKSLSFRQGKANGAADALSRCPQRSAEKEETLQAENTKILHRLQSSLARVSGLNVSGLETDVPSPAAPRAHLLPRLCQFWNNPRNEPANKSPYQVEGMSLRLQESAGEGPVG